MGLTCTLTGTAVGLNGSVLAGVVVTFALVAPENTHYTASNRFVQRQVLTATTDGSGNFSLVVARNDQLTPDDTYWEVHCTAAALYKRIAANADTLDVIAAAELVPMNEWLDGLTDPGATVVLHALAVAKGDILVATGVGTFVRLAVGTNGQVLKADSAEASGVKWASANDAPVFTSVPTSDPVSAGAVWNNGGVLMISAG